MRTKITPNLWFDGDAEEAAEFYVSVFGEGRIVTKTHYPEGTSVGTAGAVMTVEWEVRGQRFVGINGGPEFTFSEAISFQIDCEDQAEIDVFWSALTADGGSEGPCGWCKDRFGVSWQVVPRGMDDLFADADPTKAQRGFAAMTKMGKIDVSELQRAIDGVPA